MRKGTDVPFVIVLFDKMRKGKEVHFVSLAKWVVDYQQSLFFLGWQAKRARHTNDHAFLAQMTKCFSRSCVRALPSLKLKKKRDCSQSKWVGTCSGEDTNIIRVHVDTYRKEYFDRISSLKQNSKIEGVCGERALIYYSRSSVPC